MNVMIDGSPIPHFAVEQFIRTIRLINNYRNDPAYDGFWTDIQIALNDLDFAANAARGYSQNALAHPSEIVMGAMPNLTASLSPEMVGQLSAVIGDAQNVLSDDALAYNDFAAYTRQTLFHAVNALNIILMSFGNTGTEAPYYGR